MSEQSALQEAIRRAREYASKISQAKSVKRAASEIDDSLGTVKVTLAYDKPANPDRSSNYQNDSYSNNRDNNNSRRDKDSRDRGAEQPSSGVVGSYPPMLTGANAFPRGGGVPEEKIEITIPHAVIGLVIGKGGENIKRIQNETGATVRVDPNTIDEKGNKICTITGTKQAVDEAHSQVANVIENAATNKRPRMQVEGGEQYRMKIPASRTGAIIGKGGETIKQIKQQSGCDIELDKSAKECNPDESIFIIRGTQERISKARALIEARLASRGRDGDQSSRSGPGVKGVATGANATPMASHPSDEFAPLSGMHAAWAAYDAQYAASLLNQTAAYAGQELLPTSTSQQMPLEEPPHGASNAAVEQPKPDYSDAWIQYYIANGRLDYAEQVVEMKKRKG